MIDPLMVAVGLIGSRELTDEVLSEVMVTLTLLPVLKDADLGAVRKQLEATIGVSMSTGEGLSDGEILPWVEEIKASTPWHYWDSYVTQLKADGFPKSVLPTLDEDTDNVLTECGNPVGQGPWRVQGLVMGDVQSGKTANYAGLICKAADAGYKIIVLLTGMIEDLRAQSQERLDEGFIGRDSRFLLKGESSSTPVGAGRFRAKIPNVLTSIDSDFLTANHGALRGIPLVNINEPVLLVMKKNKSALENLIAYLKTQRPQGADRLDLPMLLIDDEADNASVNAKKDDDPATINRLIRGLIEKFRRATYVAYTATPFANVFINPDGNDLFPRNFVYSLKAPTSYIGAGDIFADDGKHAYQLQDITDAADAFPEKHKKTLIVERLPGSLEESIGVFLVSCAIRDLRSEPMKHRSMLINVTRFTDVQKQIAEMVRVHLYSLVEEVKQYLAGDLWSRHEQLARLHGIFMEHYSESGTTWDQVRTKLYDSIASIKVLTINQQTDRSDRLNYKAYKGTEKGRRVIAVGGLTLSRGLTLEGLCVSYFYRNSKAYDTLLQMGRWFGYRPGYVDLCRVWMAPEAQDWFSHIADVVAELRTDLRRMHINRQPPSQFGIRVKSHPETLLVTAANKMRNSMEVEVGLSFSGCGIETAYLPDSVEANDRNAKAVTSFLKGLGPARSVGSRFLWNKIEASQVAEFLQQLEISAMNVAFIPDLRTGEKPLISFIRNNSVETLGKWDVCLVQGEGDTAREIELTGQDGHARSIKKRSRQFEKTKSRFVNYLVVNKHRVGEIADEKVELTAPQLHRAEQEWKSVDRKRADKTVPGYAYRRARERPLLTIHPIEPSGPNNKSAKSAQRIVDPQAIEPRSLVAISLSFPTFEHGDDETARYSLNKVYLQQLGLLEEDEDEDQD